MGKSNIIIGWDDATCEVRSDIVFENRYKDYGAYVIRKRYSKSVIIALVISIAFLGLCVSVPYVTRWIESKKAIENAKKKSREVSVTLTDVKSLETKPEEVKPVEVEAPKIETVKFTEFVVKKDEEVPDDQVVKTQEELADKNISTKDQEGQKTIILPTEDEGNVVIDEKPKEEQIYTFVEQQPEFPGGIDAMNKYIHDKLRYPVEATENNISGRVILQFVVEKNGQVTDINVVRDPGGGCGAEAIRVVKSMPSWKAGKQNGQAVRVKFFLPINFTLQQTQQQ
jgi:periplasmic protein TonB